MLKRKQSATPVYYLFDLLFLNGEDQRDRPLLERKKKLKALLGKKSGGVQFFENIIDHCRRCFFRQSTPPVNGSDMNSKLVDTLGRIIRPDATATDMLAILQ